MSSLSFDYEWILFFCGWVSDDCSCGLYCDAMKVPLKKGNSSFIMLTAYFSNSECEKGIALFYQMKKEGIKLRGHYN